ncbi:hypothetical protein KCM76_11940 [Zooshikella marina]|uniref:hypothetical protein n=1 Tax=Zooshikella ganghwensis TaxID=202772 RepID=UPI0004113A22|nr:hypothetical protein [Zooshikella ganghwensis]MBU2706694.1 hypothetical protein [Zooshikella ganghwensis]
MEDLLCVTYKGAFYIAPVVYEKFIATLPSNQDQPKSEVSSNGTPALTVQPDMVPIGVYVEGKIIPWDCLDSIHYEASVLVRKGDAIFQAVS